MKRFKKILFVVEPGSRAKTAPQLASQLARNNNASLTLCNVGAELPRTLVNLEATYKKLHKEQLEVAFEGVELKGIKTRIQLLKGTPFIEIIREVQRGNYDLVIKSAEGRGDNLSYLFGVTDMNLMRKCPCPVWIVKDSKHTDFSRIVAAIDPDPLVPANAELNKLILELAIATVKQAGSTLHIVHAWHLPSEDLLRRTRTERSQLQVDELLKETKKSHKTWLAEALAGHDMHEVSHEVHLIKGQPSTVIPNFVDKQNVDLVVMGTVARTGIAGFFIGNTAEKILRAVDCSVLTVKPGKFETPVIP